ncbi:MAG TPA: glycosyltransferase family 4 protein [Planctomycetota bacterium]|nr:glycosyltransferase family 4 protein [Planctomycetota bacterium]
MLDVVTTHVDDYSEQIEREAAPFGLVNFLGPRLRRRIHQEYERADLVRVMSRHAERTFLDRGFPAERVFVASPPVALEEYPRATFDGERFRVLYVGQFDPWKGLNYVVDAFVHLGLPDSELQLWGAPGARPIARYLAQRMAENPNITMRSADIRRLGYGEVYGRASVLVHASLADGWGYVVAEAMASGLPVIVTATTGAAQLVEDGRNGYVVQPRDRGAIEARLEHLARNRDLVRTLGQAARETMTRQTADAFRGAYIPRVKALYG